MPERVGADKMVQLASQFAVGIYLEKLCLAKVKKLTLFAAFPYTGAANVSDARSFIMLQDLAAMINSADVVGFLN